MRSFRTLFLAITAIPAAAFAGARIDLRPTPPIPPGGYEPNTTVRIDVFFVDTGNPWIGNVMFRGLFLDFSDSTAGLSYPGDDLIPGTDDDNQFTWMNPFGVSMLFPNLPFTAWVYPLSVPNPLFQITLPDGGEVNVGHININVGTSGGIVNVMNADDPDPNHGATAIFGFGWCCDGDAPYPWRAHTGELTGGWLAMPVVDVPLPYIASSDPPDGAIDARQPINPGGGPVTYGWQDIQITFSFDGYANVVAPSEFEVAEQGGHGAVPQVSTVTAVSPSTVLLHLNSPIEPRAWTTITHVPSSTSVRLGYLPGDVNGDHWAQGIDILVLINALNGVVALPLYSTDINRSGVAEPSDILREIDLLNGAGAFDIWSGTMLP